MKRLWQKLNAPTVVKLHDGRKVIITSGQMWQIAGILVLAMVPLICAALLIGAALGLLFWNP